MPSKYESIAKSKYAKKSSGTIEATPNMTEEEFSRHMDEIEKQAPITVKKPVKRYYAPKIKVKDILA